jgi:hypothetical protein
LCLMWVVGVGWCGLLVWVVGVDCECWLMISKCSDLQGNGG